MKLALISGTNMQRLLMLLLGLTLTALAYAGDLVYLNSSAGAQRLLQADYNRQYFAVQPFVDTQENLAFCGPASMAAVLNSLPRETRPVAPQLKPFPYFTQDSFFNQRTQTIKTREATLRSGLTLQQMTEMFRQFAVNADLFYGDQLTESTFRDLMTTAMGDPNTRLVANFDRKTLNQQGAGHFSPIAAYDSASDSVLIVDVAKFKYPPFWVSVVDLLNAMNTIDSDSGKSRGLIRVRALLH
jgi:hypothetical protein